MTGKPKWQIPILGPTWKQTIAERRSTLENDSEVENGVDPPAFLTGNDYYGKFFPRGCRGMIEVISIFCKRTGAGTITLSYSLQPELGALGSVEITPGSGWAWKTGAVETMWNYDSLFIWISAIGADVSWGYDMVDPLDGHISVDDGATWADVTGRPFMRAVFTGQTEGDVPVSGIVNNIPLPSVSTEFYYEIDTLVPNVLTPLIDIYGAGYCDFIRAWVTAVADSHLTRIYVICDGATSMNEAFNMLSDWGHTADTPTISLPRYTVDGICVMLIHKRFEFRRHLRISGFNTGAAPVTMAYAYPTLLR